MFIAKNAPVLPRRRIRNRATWSLLNVRTCVELSISMAWKGPLGTI